MIDYIYGEGVERYSFYGPDGPLWKDFFQAGSDKYSFTILRGSVVNSVIVSNNCVRPIY